MCVLAALVSAWLLTLSDELDAYDSADMESIAFVWRYSKCLGNNRVWT